MTTSSTNALTEGLIHTSAETEYTAKGMVQQVQETVVSTREAQISRESLQEEETITRFDFDFENERRFVERPDQQNRDPVAQSFLCDIENGMMVTSVDLFFSSKSSVTPVQVQLRTMANGYPTQTILPFGQVFVDSANVKTSTDASEKTTFTFPSPVFLRENEEYAFVVKSNSDLYTIYSARMGDKTLDDSRLISKQPTFGSMFKSQNGSTFTAEQNEDIKFNINRAKFSTNATGTISLVNDVVPAKTLKQNPITTTSGSTTITVHHRNHGMHSTIANVTIAGVPAGSHNGIAHILASIKSLDGGNDILQCLKNAGLLKQETGDSARWWLKIMQDSRPDDQNLMDIGTQGEDATIKYEENYLLKESIEEEVVNIALRYPDEKYDVKSWRRDESGKIYPIQIESKKTYQNHFYLSRNEYETGKKFKDTYKIYYWTSDEQTEPKIIPFKKLERNIPRDKGSGVWTNVEIKPKESDFN